MSSSVERRSNPTAWAAFWFALAGLVLMPIPLFIGLILGGGLSIVAAILAVIALFKGLARTARASRPSCSPRSSSRSRGAASRSAAAPSGRSAGRWFPAHQTRRRIRRHGVRLVRMCCTPAPKDSVVPTAPKRYLSADTGYKIGVIRLAERPACEPRLRDFRWTPRIRSSHRSLLSRAADDLRDDDDRRCLVESAGRRHVLRNGSGREVGECGQPA